MKIYTKTGDGGKTSLLGGTRVAKYHLRIESYGTVDELNAHLGMLRSMEIRGDLVKDLTNIQDRLFTIGSHLASEPGDRKFKIPEIKDSDVRFVENRIDEMDSELEPMKNFVLPGGHPIIAQAHITRCVCRRAERITQHLNAESDVIEVIPIYLNRLSDYLFVLSRKLSTDLGVKETPWIPKKN